MLWAPRSMMKPSMDRGPKLGVVLVIQRLFPVRVHLQFVVATLSAFAGSTLQAQNPPLRPPAVAPAATGAPAPVAVPAARQPAPKPAPVGRLPVVVAPPVVPAAKPKIALPPKNDPKAREDARAKLLQRIRALRAQELAEVLKPDAVAVTKVVEIAGGFEDKLIATRQELRQKRSDLNKLLKDPKPNDGALTKIADQLLTGRRRLEEIEYERTQALRKVLTPTQFAKVVVSWARINRKIQETLYRALLKAKADASGMGFEE